MRKLSLLYLVSLAVLAVAIAVPGRARAQDKVDVLMQSNVTAYSAAIAFLPDGGCTVQAQGVAAYDSGVVIQVQSATYAFNGARCGVARNAATNAVNLSVGVGGGQVP